MQIFSFLSREEGNQMELKKFRARNLSCVLSHNGEAQEGRRAESISIELFGKKSAWRVVAMGVMVNDE
jgi:hypothetical protein